MNSKKIYLLLLPVFLLCCQVSMGQSATKNERTIAALVKQFNKGKIVKADRSDIYSNVEVALRNDSGQVLRFKTFKNKPVAYHCGIVFQLFEFKSGMLYKTSLYDKDGQPAGETEFDNSSITEYIIEKPDLLKERLAMVEEDGNMDTKDADEKIVLVKIFTPEYKLIRESYIASSEYWRNLHMLYRP